MVRNIYVYSPRFRASAPLRAKTSKHQILSLQRRYPDVDGFGPERSWGVVVLLFRGANGFFGKAAPNMVAAVTSSLSGCILYDQQLAEFAAGGGDEALDFVQHRSRPGNLPPGPLLGIAARAVATMQQRKTQQEI